MFPRTSAVYKHTHWWYEKQQEEKTTNNSLFFDISAHSAAEYLVERCHVTKRREHLYKKHFQNYDKDKDQKLNLKVKKSLE